MCVRSYANGSVSRIAFIPPLVLGSRISTFVATLAASQFICWLSVSVVLQTGRFSVSIFVGTPIALSLSILVHGMWHIGTKAPSLER